MQVEEAFKLFELMSNISYLGLIGILFFIAVIMLGSYTFLIKDKNDKVTRKTYFRLGLFSFSLIVISFMVIKVDADNRNALLQKANILKSTFSVMNFKILGYNRIRKMKEMNQFDTNVLNKLTDRYPTEFIKVTLTDPEDTFGIRLIEPQVIKKIDDYNIEHLPFIKETILGYMVRNKIDTLSYKQVRDSIDVYFDDEWIELMLSKYDSIFTPYSIKNITDYSQSHRFILKNRKIYRTP